MTWYFDPAEVLSVYNIAKLSIGLALVLISKLLKYDWTLTAAELVTYLGIAKAVDDFHDTPDMLLGVTAALVGAKVLLSR